MKKTCQLHCKNCEMRDKSVFCELDPKALDILNANKTISSYSKGEVIFHQGSTPEGVYCIHSGKVKLSTSGANGKNTIIEIVSGGGIVGYRSLFAESHYHATATVLENAEICYLEKSFFLSFMNQEPTISKQIIKHLAQNIDQKNKSISDLTQKNIRERLAGFLESSAQNFGVKDEQGIKIQLQLSREEIASVVGVATETLIRTLSDFKAEKLIILIDKTIYIPDLEKVKKIAQSSV